MTSRRLRNRSIRRSLPLPRSVTTITASSTTTFVTPCTPSAICSTAPAGVPTFAADVGSWGYVIPVLLHNFKGYDSRLILHSLQSIMGVRIIPQQGESILSISFNNLLFLGSLSFLQSSLDSAVTNLAKSCRTDDRRTRLWKVFSHLVRFAETKGAVDEAGRGGDQSPSSVTLQTAHMNEVLH